MLLTCKKKIYIKDMSQTSEQHDLPPPEVSCLERPYDFELEHDSLAANKKAVGRHFCLVMWNWMDDPVEIYGGHCSYILWQREVCPKTGRRHLQMYIQMALSNRDHKPKPTHANTIRKLNPLGRDDEGQGIGSRVVRCRGSSDQNYTYCTKTASRDPDDWQEEGDAGPFEWMAEGVTRMYPFAAAFGSPESNLTYYRKLREGTFDPHESESSYIFAITKNSQVQVAQQIREREERAKIDFTKTRVFIHWGVPRSGKSWNAKYAIYERIEDPSSPVAKYKIVGEDRTRDDFYVVSAYSSSGIPWFNDYAGQPRIIFNEICASRVSFDDILEICDIYYHQVQKKGGLVWRAWTEVHLIGNSSPDTWFPKRDILPLLQRVAAEGCIFYYGRAYSAAAKYAQYTASQLLELSKVVVSEDIEDDPQPDVTEWPVDPSEISEDPSDDPRRWAEYLDEPVRPRMRSKPV